MSTNYKCPRCKNKLDENDVFCKKCGTPVKSDIDKAKKNNNYRKKVNNAKTAIKLDEDIKDTKATVADDVVNTTDEDLKIVPTKMLDSSDMKKNISRSEKIKELLLIFISLVLVCSVLLNILQLRKINSKKCEECKKCEDNPISETRNINIEGYDFAIDEDWLLNVDNEKLSLSNNDESVNLYFSIKNTNYDVLVIEENMKKYIEDLQVKENVFINKNKAEEKDGNKYYYLEGTKDGFPYMIILVAKDDKTFSVTAVFEDNKNLEDYKDKILDIVLKSNKK